METTVNLPRFDDPRYDPEKFMEMRQIDLVAEHIKLMLLHESLKERHERAVAELRRLVKAGADVYQVKARSKKKRWWG